MSGMAEKDGEATAGPAWVLGPAEVGCLGRAAELTGTQKLGCSTGSSREAWKGGNDPRAVCIFRTWSGSRSILRASTGSFPTAEGSHGRGWTFMCPREDAVSSRIMTGPAGRREKNVSENADAASAWDQPS